MEKDIIVEFFAFVYYLTYTKRDREKDIHFLHKIINIETNSKRLCVAILKKTWK